MLKTSQKLLQFSLSSLAAVTLGSVYCDRSYALSSGFTGGYDPSKFLLTNTNADGSVIATANTVILTGGDNNSFNPGTTDWTITLDFGLNPDQEGSGSFDWSYASLDEPGNDEAGIVFVDNLGNETFSRLSDTNGNTSIGFTPVTFIVDNTVTKIGFRVATVDNFSGAGELTISNFNFVQVPFEFSPTIGLLSLGAFAVYKSLRKQK